MQFVIVAALSLVIASVSAYPMPHNDSNKTSFKKHKDWLQNFTCGHPQPKVFEQKELRNNSDYTELMEIVTRGEKVYPAVTILHRCQCTGYCSNTVHNWNYRCLPTAVVNVRLTFSYTEPVGNGNGKRKRYLNIEEKNHTKCECRSPSEDDE